MVPLRKKKAVAAVAMVLALASLLYLHPSFSFPNTGHFNRMVDGIQQFDSVAEAIDFGVKESFDRFEIPDYLTSRDGSDVLKYTMPFDPRFSLGLVLYHVALQLERSKSVDEVSLPFFHWADYVDLGSALNEHYFSPDKTNCKDLFDVTTSSNTRNRKQELIDPAHYCVDASLVDAFLADPATSESEQRKILLAQSRPVSTGWHIFDYGGRSRLALKILHAKSYLEGFMDPPRSVILLVPTLLGPASVRVPVNQEITGRERLAQNLMLDEYLAAFRLESQNTPVVDVGRQLARMSDLMVKYTTVEPLARTKILGHDNFTADCQQIVESIGDDVLESARAYKQLLEYSLSLPRPPKYFREAKIVKKEAAWAHGGHYDWRFFSGLINFTDRQAPVLHGLLQAYLKFANANKVTTWVAHGSLLSWYWNGVAFPWDNDIDVQVPIQDLHRLSRDFNQSVIVDFGGESGHEVRYGRYFLDCGTFISHRTAGNGNNNIDARFIDMDTGFYIDITGLALSDEKAPPRYDKLLPTGLARTDKNVDLAAELNRNKELQVYNCRHHHFARLAELSPLSLLVVEGQYTYVPARYEQLLVNEYGTKGLADKVYKIFTFVPKLQLWIRTQQLRRFTNNRGITWLDEQTWRHWRDLDYVQFLEENPEHFAEYLSTRKLTSMHRSEMSLRNWHRDSEGYVCRQVELDPLLTNLRHDYFSFLMSHKDYDFRLRSDELRRQYEQHDQALAQQQLAAESAGEGEKESGSGENVEGEMRQKEGANTDGGIKTSQKEGTDDVSLQSAPEQDSEGSKPMPKLQTADEGSDASMRRPQPDERDPDQLR